ncbi:hypothetical protein D3OALGA1CA_2638 [Olavius algarvensis associated proteobacterium Delta 3]|nr:hypothetical protein D3OALGA1CA_2638 [Olavius algarvensis associated proteobacterium Delta 3]
MKAGMTKDPKYYNATGCCPNRFYRAVFSSMTHALSTNMGA